MQLIAALALLAAQQIYGPYQHGPHDFAPVVAVAPHGMLMAWSEIEPGARVASIHVALLNHPDWVRSGRIRETGFNARAPAVVADGDDFLIIWSTPRGLKAQRIEDGELRQQPSIHPDRLTFDASISAAGSLVVFDSDADVFGTVIGGDGFGPVVPIAAGDDFDAQARVLRVGEQRYLVTWIRNGAWIAAQFVETER